MLRNRENAKQILFLAVFARSFTRSFTR